MYDPFCLKPSGNCRPGFSNRDTFTFRRHGKRFPRLHQVSATCGIDGSIDASTTQSSCIGRIDNRVAGKLNDASSRHGNLCASSPEYSVHLHTSEGASDFKS
mmetsp:Transcript_11645/g.18559  ORF Transcript_11645/g.18559 Transcript_11645/m.18559 type:complete len:102 (-) Transcript_11645:42-347(-)